MMPHDTTLFLEPLTQDQIERLLAEPDGAHRLLECCRDGRIDPEVAAGAIDRFQNTPVKRIKRFFLAVVDAALGTGR